MIIVKSQVKEYTTGSNVASDFVEELDKKVVELIKAAVKRAEANNRKTVMAKDL